MEKVKTTQSVGNSQRLNQRLIIKSVQDAHEFLNKRDDNKWQIYDGPLKAGTYAFCGGEWRNVKTLDPTLLAHV